MKLFETAFTALKALKKTGPKPDPAALQESETEFIARTADITAAIPHWNKGLILERRGDKTGAIAAYYDAIKAVPHYYDAHANLVRLLCEEGKWEDAIKHGQMAVRLRRNSPRVYNNLSVAFYNKGDVAKALYSCAAAIQLAPDDLDFIENLSQMRQSHPEMERDPMAAEARRIWREVAEKHFDNGLLHLKQKRAAEAVVALRIAVRLAPEWAEPTCALASILAAHPDDAIRDAKQALELAQRAMDLGDRSPQYYDVLAAAYANASRFLEARQTIEELLPTLKKNGPLEAAVRFADRQRLYMERKPLRQEIPIVRTTARVVKA